MEKPTNTVIKEMEKHCDAYLKNSTPWRQVNRAIKKLQKLEKIEQIVNEWNNNASHSFEDMCKINTILKE